MTDQTSTLTFQAGLATRFLDTCLALILSVALSMLAICFSVGLGVAAVKAGLPKSPAIGFVVVVIALLLRLSWKVPSSRQRFFLVLHPEYLQIGRGILRRDVPYEEIDEVSIPGQSHGEWIVVRYGSTRTRIILSQNDGRLCFNLLAHVCPYAIFVDSDGKVYARPQTNRPERALLAYERLQRRRAFLLLLATMFAPVFGLLLSWVTWQWLLENRWLPGKIVLTIKAIIVLVVLGPSILFSPVVLARLAWRSWHDARRARSERYDLAARTFPLDDPPKPAHGEGDAGS